MKKTITSFPQFAALSILAAATLPAAAQSAGDTVMNVGWFHLTTNDSSKPLTRTAPGPATQLSGSGASVGDADTLGLALTYFATDNFALTVDGGVPPKFKLKGEGTLSALGELGTAKQWSPAVIAKWYFGGANDKFRPFVGLGVTHVWYSDAKLSSSLQTLTAGPGGRSTVSLSNSWSPVANVGVTYNFDKKWSLGFSVSYIPLDTDATITARPVAGPNRTFKTKLTLDPVVTFLSVGYKF